jgi:hypothetical protein
MLLRMHQKIAPEWASNLVGLFEILSFARGSEARWIGAGWFCLTLLALVVGASRFRYRTAMMYFLLLLWLSFIVAGVIVGGA